MMDFETYRNHIIKISQELGYPKHVRDNLLNAKSENECTRIMSTARNSIDWR